MTEKMAKRPGIYSDIGKKTRDLLYKDYTQQPPAHFHYNQVDCSFNFSLQLCEILPGLNTLLKVIFPDPKSSKVELECSHDYFGITATTTLTAKPVLKFSGVIGGNLFSIGSRVSFDRSRENLTKYDAGFSLTTSFLDASLTLNDKFDILTGSCYLNVRPLTYTAIAAEATYQLSSRENVLTVGIQHAPTQSTLVKAKINSFGNVGASVKQALFGFIFMTLAGEADLREFNRSARLSLGLSLSACMDQP